MTGTNVEVNLKEEKQEKLTETEVEIKLILKEGSFSEWNARRRVVRGIKRRESEEDKSRCIFRERECEWDKRRSVFKGRWETNCVGRR